ncbi:hypothetical protein [Arhodomonas sp. SL1]|uniref:hypothetical protein n=1 Tax=Arhodomonas sp. SL1 TaxID=3425691 RepID=UPI003F88206E
MNQFLLTIAVIAVVVIVLRFRGAGAAAKRVPRRQTRHWPPSRRAMAGYALVALLIVAVSTVVYLQWAEQHRVVTVRVVDTESGDQQEYLVYKKDVGGRSFRTVDGRYVSLSASDRMELDEAPER